MTLRLIQAGKPTQNAYVESFNGKFRDECLNEHWLRSLAEAREIIGAWRAHYNQRRPHSALGYQSPREVRCRLACPACLAGSKRIGYTHQQEFYELILGSK